MLEMTAVEEQQLRNRCFNFVKECYRAFRLLYDFWNMDEIPVDKFIKVLKDEGVVKSEVDFIDLFYRTRDCFDTGRINGCPTIVMVHPDKFNTYMKSIMAVPDKYYWG